MSHKLDNMQSQRGVSTTPRLTDLAKKANVSDFTLIRIENGGTADPHVTQRIADAMGVSLTTLGKQDQ